MKTIKIVYEGKIEVSGFEYNTGAQKIKFIKNKPHPNPPTKGLPEIAYC